MSLNLNLHSSFYKKFLELLNSTYPSSNELIEKLDFQHIVSPFILQLDKTIFYKVQEFVTTINKISKDKSYKNFLVQNSHIQTPFEPQNYSVLMAYDFHVTENKIALIEINTNAAMYLVSDLIYKTHNFFSEPSYEKNHSINKLKKSFKEEFSLFSQSDNEPQKIVITDENIKGQNRYIEFLMYFDLFKEWGWNPEIIDFNLLKVSEDKNNLLTPDNKEIDFLYNRYCDFYLDDSISSPLKEAFENNLCCFSPNPFQYFLLADKQRMIDIGSKDFSKNLNLSENENAILLRHLLTTKDCKEFNSKEELWMSRKKYFFKPKNEYGGRSAYRGEKITRSVFERVFNENFLVQEFCPPSKPQIVNLPSDMNPSEWKYDLRFYVYQDQIQQVVSRVYKGQLTNFSEKFSGFSAVQFNYTNSIK